MWSFGYGLCVINVMPQLDGCGALQGAAGGCTLRDLYHRTIVQLYCCMYTLPASPVAAHGLLYMLSCGWPLFAVRLLGLAACVRILKFATHDVMSRITSASSAVGVSRNVVDECCCHAIHAVQAPHTELSGLA
jgi:hypothetical protein